MPLGAPPCTKGYLTIRALREGEVVLLQDLSAYLDHPHVTVKKLARRNGWLKKANGSTSKVFYVTALAAMKLIMLVRSIQGSVYLAGRDFHKEREKRRAQKKDGEQLGSKRYSLTSA